MQLDFMSVNKLCEARGPRNAQIKRSVTGVKAMKVRSNLDRVSTTNGTHAG